MTESPVVVIGSGDHARVVGELVVASRRRLVGYVAPTPDSDGPATPIVGVLDHIGDWATDDVEFSVGIGDNATRAAAFDSCIGAGLRPASLVHPAAVVLSGASVEAGAQVCAGAIIGVDAVVAANAIVNTAASVDHDCIVSRHATVAPGAHLGGRVVVEEGGYIGMGAVVHQGITIGRWSLVGAGAAVVRDVPMGTRVVGVPARPMEAAAR